MQIFSNVVSFITEISTSKFVNYIIVSLSILILVTLLVLVIVSVVKKKKVDYIWAKYLITAIFLTNLWLTVCEFLTSAETFKNVPSIISFNLSLLSVILLFSTALRVIKNYKISKAVKGKNEVVNGINVSENETPVSTNAEREVLRIKCVSPTTYNGEYDGFLDVSYLKSLLNLLKQKDLTEEDVKAVDDFEVYLMNFASRQPYRSERIKLSGYLSDFMKKLARYNVC